MTTKLSHALVCMFLVVAFTCGAALARAQSMAMTGVTATSYSSNSWTWGWSFTVGSSDILVTHLGTWDRDANGLAQAHQIGIWAESGQSLVLSDTLSSGTVHGIEAGFRWKELATPVTLLANTAYRIGDNTVSGFEDQLYASSGQFAVNPQLTFGGEVGNGTDTFSYPAIYYGTGATIGPNFKFDAVVPEPAFVQLPLLMGLGGAGLWWRRRARS